MKIEHPRKKSLVMNGGKRATRSNQKVNHQTIPILVIYVAILDVKIQ